MRKPNAEERIARRKGPPVYYCCRCGAFASFGVGVLAFQPSSGRWYCHAHRPAPAIEPEPTPQPTHQPPPRRQGSLL